MGYDPVLGNVSDVSYEQVLEGLGFAIMGDPGVVCGVEGSLFRDSGLSDLIGKYLPLPA